MSGIEVIGIALALPPIIASALEFYKYKAEILRDWWRYKSTLTELVLDIQCQDCLLTENVELLLHRAAKYSKNGSFNVESVSTNLAEVIKEDKELARSLELYLATSQRPFLDIFNKVQEVLTQLQVSLGVVNGKVEWLDKDQNKIRERLKALKIMAKKKDTKLLVYKLDQLNKQLASFLKNATELAPFRDQARIQAVGEAPRVARKEAQAFYNALSLHWGCDCAIGAHSAGLVLGHHGLENGSESFIVYLSARHAWYESLFFKSEACRSFAQGKPLVELSTVHLDAVHSRQYDASTFEVPTPRSNQASPPNDSLCWGLVRPPPERILVGETPVTLSTRQYLILQTLTDQSEYTSVKLRDLLLQCSASGPTVRPRLPRGQRMLIAARCAKTLLLLHNTPWTEHGITSSRVLFLTSRPVDSSFSEEVPKLPKPLIIADFASHPAGASSQAENLSPAQREREARIILRELAILLMELCYGQTLEEISHYSELKALSSNVEHDGIFRHAAACRWQQDVLSEAGQDYSDVVRRCLDCNFGLTTIDFNEPDFWSRVSDFILEPLQKLAAVFGEPL